MRPALLDPFPDDTRVHHVSELVHDVYRHHEAGLPYTELLPSLSDLAGHPVSAADIDAAFGALPAESYARDLLLQQAPCPTDLSRSELLELVQCICDAAGEEWQLAYWSRCVEANTGCSDLATLIFYPEQYFAPGQAPLEMSSAAILQEALSGQLRHRKHPLVTAPPKGFA